MHTDMIRIIITLFEFINLNSVIRIWVINWLYNLCNLPLFYFLFVFSCSKDSKLMFATVGNQAYRLWKIDEDDELLFFDVELPENDLNLTSICSTPKLQSPYNASLVLIGTNYGDVILNNPENGQYLAKIKQVMGSTITLIECRANAIILADDLGNIVRNSIKPGEGLFTEPGIILSLDGAVSGISFDENLEEGHIGTANTLLHVNWKDGTCINVLHN